MAKLKEHERTVNFGFYFILVKLGIVTDNWYFDIAFKSMKEVIQVKTRRP